MQKSYRDRFLYLLVALTASIHFSSGLGKLSEGLKLSQKSFGFIRFDIAEGVSIVHE